MYCNYFLCLQYYKKIALNYDILTYYISSSFFIKTFCNKVTVYILLHIEVIFQSFSCWLGHFRSNRVVLFCWWPFSPKMPKVRLCLFMFELESMKMTRAMGC